MNKFLDADHYDHLIEKSLQVREQEFREFVDYLFQSKRDGVDGQLHAAVGLAGEAGEVLDHMKKAWVYDREIDREKVLEEMGDTIHYLMMLCIKMDVEFGDLMLNNVTKLRKRYPNGFTKKDAIARADKIVTKEPTMREGINGDPPAIHAAYCEYPAEGCICRAWESGPLG